MNPSSNFSKNPSAGIRRRTVRRPLAKEEILVAKPDQKEEEDAIIITETETDFDTSKPSFLSSPPSFAWKRYLLSPAAGVGAGIILIAILVSTVFARLTVNITPRVETLSVNGVAFSLNTSASQLLVEDKILPAELLEFNQSESREFEATGLEDIAEKSRGTVRIYNRHSSSPQRLVGRTRFLTEKGILYRLPSDIIIPGASIEDGKIAPKFIEAELVADETGERGNLSGEITLKIPGFQGSPKYEGFYAVAANGFSGGYKGEARVATNDDIKKAETELTRRVYDKLNQEFTTKIPPEFNSADTLREIEIMKIDSPRIGTAGDRFRVEVNARARAFIFRKQDLISFLNAALLAGAVLPQNLLEDSLSLRYTPRNINYERGLAEIMLEGDAKAETKVPEQELASLLKGGDKEFISNTLKNRPEVESFKISFFPPWRNSAPQNTKHIRFKLDDPTHNLIP